MSEPITSEDLGKDFEVNVDERWRKVRLIGITITDVAILQEPEWAGGQILMARLTSTNLRRKTTDHK